MRRTLVVLALTASLLTSCGGDERLVIVTASSLTDVVEALAAEAGIEAAISGAGSQTIVSQILGGAPADVVLLADPELAARLVDAATASEPTTVARTTLAIAVRADRTEVVTGPVDLARQELRVVLADEQVPLGRYTRAAYRQLEDTGEIPADTLDAVLRGAESFEDAARSVLTKVEIGEADAAVVFASDRRLATDLPFLDWPTDVDVRYVAQVLAATDHPELSREFVSFLTSPAAAPVWRRSGLDPAR